MENLKTLAICIVVAAAMLAGGWVIAPQQMRDSFGSVASPIINWPYFGFGDVIEHRAKTSSLNTASTTVCSLLSPAATSTLQDATVRFTVSSSTASVVSFSKGPGFASTTLLQNYSVGANAQATISLFGTTTSAGIDNLVFAPSQYFNVTMSGGIGTFSPTGTCQATWQAI
jgi:hypothetical protein